MSHVEFACSAFNVLRENRNLLIHTHTIFPQENGKPQWCRSTGKPPILHARVEADEDDLNRILDDIAKLSAFALDLVAFIRPRKGKKPKQYPVQFAMPVKLKSV